MTNCRILRCWRYIITVNVCCLDLSEAFDRMNLTTALFIKLKNQSQVQKVLERMLKMSITRVRLDGYGWLWWRAVLLLTYFANSEQIKLLPWHSVSGQKFSFTNIKQAIVKSIYSILANVKDINRASSKHSFIQIPVNGEIKRSFMMFIQRTCLLLQHRATLSNILS